jgi:DNA-binding transcriptional LysR family regulator
MQDLRTLAIFVKVAERRSFVRAAAELGITQSGVSNAISRLEQQVGTRLLARTTRRVSLTEHGAAYFERCRQALAALEEAELVLKDSQLEPATCALICRYRLAVSKSCHYLVRFRRDIRISSFESRSLIVTSI